MTSVRVGLARGGAPALLLVAEAAWVSLLFDALANGTASVERPAVDLPYLAFVLPALAALLVAGAWRGTQRARRTLVGRLRFLGGAGCVLVGAALSVWVIDGLDAPPVGRALGWAVAVSVLAWGRGVWLALGRSSVRQGGTTLVLGSIVFVVVLASRASVRPPFERATSGAGWLLFCFFVCGVLATLWLRQRDVEREALGRGPSLPGAWLGVALVPVVVVALLAFLVAGAGGGAGPAVVSAARGVGAVVGGAGHWIFVHLPTFTIHPSHRLHLRPPGIGGTLSPGQRRTQTRTIDLFGYWLIVIVGLLLLAALVFLVRFVVALLRRRAAERDSEDEERESIFSWAHVAHQVGAMLRAMLRAVTRRIAAALRRRRPARGSGPPDRGPGLTAYGDRDVVSVRAAYRTVLVALRRAALGRHPAETPRELATRLSSVAGDLPLDALDALGALTELYEHARYAFPPRAPGAEPANAPGATEDDHAGAATSFGRAFTTALERRMPKK